jgi:hypothetical protein
MNRKKLSSVRAAGIGIMAVFLLQSCSKVGITPNDVGTTDLSSTAAGENSGLNGSDSTGSSGSGSSGATGSDSSGSDSSLGGSQSSSGSYGSAGTDTGYPAAPGLKTESFVFTPDRKADIILVIDNSTSMQPEANKLAANFYLFLKRLKELNVNWQMCITTTDIYDHKGNSLNWAGLNKPVFSKADAAVRTDAAVTGIFTTTFNALFPGPVNSGDERGIAALSRNVDAQASNGCYRPGSVVAPIILSDEDERSWGGSQALFDWEKQLAVTYGSPLPNASNLVLQPEDSASNYFEKMRSLGYGNLIVSSIVVDNDTCRNTQQTTLDSKGYWYPAYIGKQYQQLSSFTSGVVNSICNSDFSNGLLNFADRIGSSNNSFKLLCAPKTGTLKVSAAGLSQPGDYVTTLSGQTLSVSSASATAFKVDIQYECE